MKKILVAVAAAVLLTSCEVEDDLEIRPDGSGTNRARITVQRILSGSVLGRIRDDAERQGFRIVEEGRMEGVARRENLVPLQSCFCG